MIQRNKLYIPKAMQESGFQGEIEICPNQIAAAIYPKNVPKEEVVKSLKLVVLDLENEVEREKLKTCNEV
jgi:hypothetical protein